MREKNVNIIYYEQQPFNAPNLSTDLGAVDDPWKEVLYITYQDAELSINGRKFEMRESHLTFIDTIIDIFQKRHASSKLIRTKILWEIEWKPRSEKY